jgi:hypothetical protein
VWRFSVPVTFGAIASVNSVEVIDA